MSTASVESKPAAAPDAATPEPAAAVVEEEQSGYKGFGSFHSDNVEDLIAIPDDQYQPPASMPAWALKFPGSGSPPAAFGKAMRAEHFYLEDDWTFINHGAFGGALKQGVEVKHRYEALMEQQPLRFVDRMLLPQLVTATRALARFLKAKPQDVVLVTNATFGLNAAINAVLKHKTDHVAFLDVEYGSVWKMMRERCHDIGCSGTEIQILPHFRDEKIMGSDEALTAFIESKLPAGCNAFVFDHLTSTSGIALPVFTHIIPMLRRNGITNIVVDGAHGPLQFPLDFNSLPEEAQPAFYVGNLHKWVACPKAVGFIWARPDMHKRAHTPIVSHGSRSGYLSEFIWDGTKDYGAYLAIPSVMDFWTNTVGIENARRYCTTLLEDAETMLCGAWGSKPLPRGAPFMKLIPLPGFLANADRFHGKFIQDTLHDRYKIELPVKNVNGELFVRCSAYVNNCIEDYEKLRDAVLDMQSLLKKRRRLRDDGTEDKGDNDNDMSQATPPQPRKGSAHNCGGCGIPVGGKAAHWSESDSDGDAS